MRLLLHIGTAKTGTSTLQTALTRNSRLLRRSGVLYPVPKFDKTNHNFLTALVHPFDEMPREFLQGGPSRDQLDTMAATFWDDIRRQVRAHDPSLTILSGEYLYGLSDTKIERLRDILATVFEQVEIVCYVREPGAYYVSLMQQRVRGSFVVDPPDTFQLRARACITRYLDAFDGHAHVRPFDRDALVDGDVVRDFLTTYVPGGSELAGRVSVPRENESMSAEAMCILQAVRRHGWPDENNRFKPESNRIIEVLARLRDTTGQTTARLRPEIDAAYVRRHRRDLDFLADRFGIHFAGIATPAPDGAPDPPGMMSDDLRDILDVDPARVERTLYLLLKELAG